MSIGNNSPDTPISPKDSLNLKATRLNRRACQIQYIAIDTAETQQLIKKRLGASSGIEQTKPAIKGSTARGVHTFLRARCNTDEEN